MPTREDADSTPATTQEAIEHIEAHAAALRDEHVARAVARLDEQGDLTPQKRVVVAALADRLTTRLLEPPKAGLRAAADVEQHRASDVALELFGES